MHKHVLFNILLMMLYTFNFRWEIRIFPRSFFYNEILLLIQVSKRNICYVKS